MSNNMPNLKLICSKIGSDLLRILTFPLPWASVHWLVQCTLQCHWLTQCTLGYHWATQRIRAGYTGTPLEKLRWNSPHWNATGETNFCSLHWNTTGGTVTAHTSPDTYCLACRVRPCQFEMTRWRDTSKQVDRSLYIQPLLGVYCSEMDTSSALNTCEYLNIILCMSLIWASL